MNLVEYIKLYLMEAAGIIKFIITLNFFDCKLYNYIIV